MRAIGMLLFATSLIGLNPALASQLQKPSPFPVEITAAWEKAGAQAGWIAPDELGNPVFRVGVHGQEGEIPAFKFKEWKPGVIGLLPTPKRGFGLSLHYPKMTNAGLKDLAGLKSLQSLELRLTEPYAEPNLTQAGLKELAGLQSLQSLYLCQSMHLSDAGLKEMPGRQQLRTLNVAGTQVTGIGLAEFKSLHTLNLAATQLSPDGLKELVTLTQLQNLDLTFVHLNDNHLKELTRLKSLHTLNLSFMEAVTGEGLKDLAGLKSLRTLHLGGTAVVKSDLKGLIELKSLQTLYLHHPLVADGGLKLKELAGVKSLKSLHLDCWQLTDIGLQKIAH